MDFWKAALLTLASQKGYGGGVEEHKFHPVRRWRFDLAWPELRVAFEKEGMTPGEKSRHTTYDGYSKDCEKYNAAQLLSWIVIRGTAKQIESGKAATDLLAALEMRSKKTFPY